jgi:histidinol-phosphate/aromatic aminotransferase/cobyric acid decarboxylase-like protein
MAVLPDDHPEFMGLGEKFFRITVSNREENERVLTALKRIIVGERENKDCFVAAQD